MRHTTADLCVKASEEIIRLMGIIDKIDTTIFAIGAEVNGDEDSDGVLIPCRVKETWSPVIDLENGTIENWPEGVTASVHYKVCDDGIYRLLDAERKTVKEIDGYVPKIMSPGGSGYGDYVIMKIGATGKIDNWSVDLEEFEDEK